MRSNLLLVLASLSRLSCILAAAPNLHLVFDDQLKAYGAFLSTRSSTQENAAMTTSTTSTTSSPAASSIEFAAVGSSSFAPTITTISIPSAAMPMATQIAARGHRMLMRTNGVGHRGMRRQFLRMKRDNTVNTPLQNPTPTIIASNATNIEEADANGSDETDAAGDDEADSAPEGSTVPGGRTDNSTSSALATGPSSTSSFVATTSQTYTSTSASSNSSSPSSTSTATSPTPSKNSTVTAQTSIYSPSPTAVSQGSSVFNGVSSYYIFALNDVSRIQVLDAIRDGGFKVIRIFVAGVGANNKGSDSVAVDDLEQAAVGSYDATILRKIDQLMLECHSRNLKLLIACHDRYALGFWSTDRYATSYKIAAPGSSGVQQLTDASAFYNGNNAIAAFDRRLTAILTHKNELMGGKQWSELDEVIFAFEAQNEPQGYMTAEHSATWLCDRSSHLKSLLPSSSSIQISSGGGITLATSLEEWATSCSSIDIVSVHDYGTDAASTVAAIVAKKQATGKQIILGEWGIKGDSKEETVRSFVRELAKQGVSWMYWEVVKPGKASSDFEIWTDEPAWRALTSANTPAPQFVNQAN